MSSNNYKIWAQNVLPIVFDDYLQQKDLIIKLVQYVNGLVGDAVTLNNDFESIDSVTIGDLEDLHTTAKDSIVDAINEVEDDVEELKTDKLDVPEIAGTSGQVLVSNGEGGQVWADVESGEVVVDSTLSISGAAADAKVTGDEITSVKADINDKIPTDYHDNLYSNPMVGVRTQASGTQLTLSTSGGVPNPNYLTARIPVSANTAYTVAFSELTDYCVLVTSSAEITPASFSAQNPITLADYKVISTSRQLVYNFTTDANAQYLYICSTIAGNTDAYIYVCEGTISNIVLPTSWVKYLDAYNKAETNEITKPLTDMFSVVSFNGTSSVCTVNTISLSQNGDEVELEVIPAEMSNNALYSFATHSNTYKIAIAFRGGQIGVRSLDETWVCPITNISVASKYVIKIVYSDGNILTYVNGTLIYTYTGQKRIVIEGFGKNTYYDYWKGYVGYIKVNGVKYVNITKLSGFTGTNLVASYPYGFLSLEQHSEFVQLANKIKVVPTANKVSVYVPIANSYYGKIDIDHINDHSDDPYIDYWRVTSGALYKSSDGENFVSVGSSMMIGAENEMAISFQGMGDFTGGYHGDERIDLDDGCYIKFIVDGAEYSITDLVNLGTVKCDSFSYREVSTLYASYSYNANHLPIAKHYKNTVFEERGFKTTNYVEMDLSELSVSVLKMTTAFTGLFCIATPFALTAVGDTGNEYTGTHPTVTTTLAENINKYCLRVKTYNNKYSCEVNSKLVRTNVNAIMNPPINVDIMDRQQDLKYYSYLPNNVDLITGDYIATESSIAWAVCE